MACKIILKDEVNCKIEGLDPRHKKEIEKELKSSPYAYHVPAFKLGRWDGCAYFTIGGVTYTNLLDIIIPEIVEENYTIELDDSNVIHMGL